MYFAGERDEQPAPALGFHKKEDKLIRCSLIHISLNKFDFLLGKNKCAKSI